jgi:DNA polymerase-3 subunit beta
MKFRTTKEKLFSALNETNKIIPIRTTLPILSCVLIKTDKNKVVLTATDLEQTVITEIQSEIPEEGSIAVPGNRLMEIVAALPSGPIEIICKEDKEIEISSPKGVYKIMGKEPSEYPETPQLNSEQQIEIKGSELLDIINNTLYAVSKDDLKPALCGIYLNIIDNKITAVSTDGHRLVKYEKEVESKNPEGSIIIPGKFFSVLKNNINVTGNIFIKMSENHIEVTENNTTTITRIIKESFPDFNSVIPDTKNNMVQIDAQDLSEAVKRVSIFSNKTTRQIILSFNNNEVVVSTEDKETKSSAKEHISCEFKGETLSVAYNAQYLREVVQHLDDKTVNIFLGTPRTAAVFKPKKVKDKTKLTALLMPLRTAG